MIKQEILNACLLIIEEKIAIAQKLMDAAQAAANEEGKSSAGDKYETGRAMAQIERDKSAHRLAEAIKAKALLLNVPITKKQHKVALGSLVTTDLGRFFFAVALGKIEIKGDEYFIISPISPLGQELLNKNAGDKVSVNGRSYLIKTIE